MQRGFAEEAWAGLGHNSAEAPLAVTKLSDAARKFGFIKIRPEGIDEHHLGIGALPQQEVAHPLFAAGADQQIGVGQTSRPQMGIDGFFRDITHCQITGLYPSGDALRGVKDIIAPAVTERDRETESEIIGRLLHSNFNHLVNIGRQPVEITDETQSNALLMELFQFVAQVKSEQPHERADFTFGPPPVFRRETKQREIADQTKKIADSKLAYETADEDSKDARKEVLEQDQKQMENIRSK